MFSCLCSPSFIQISVVTIARILIFILDSRSPDVRLPDCLQFESCDKLAVSSLWTDEIPAKPKFSALETSFHRLEELNQGIYMLNLQVELDAARPKRNERKRASIHREKMAIDELSRCTKNRRFRSFHDSPPFSLNTRSIEPQTKQRYYTETLFGNAWTKFEKVVLSLLALDKTAPGCERPLSP